MSAGTESERGSPLQAASSGRESPLTATQTLTRTSVRRPADGNSSNPGFLPVLRSNIARWPSGAATPSDCTSWPVGHLNLLLLSARPCRLSSESFSPSPRPQPPVHERMLVLCKNQVGNDAFTGPLGNLHGLSGVPQMTPDRSLGRRPAVAAVASTDGTPPRQLGGRSSGCVRPAHNVGTSSFERFGPTAVQPVWVNVRTSGRRQVPATVSAETPPRTVQLCPLNHLPLGRRIDRPRNPRRNFHTFRRTN